MALVWLLLFLGSWVRLLAVAGLGLHHGAIALAMAPLLFVAIHHFFPGLLRVPNQPSGRWILASLTALLSLAFVRLTLLRFWDPAEWLPTTLLALVGLGLALFATEEGPADRGPGPWLWISFWMLLSARDSSLGLLGAGLAPLIFMGKAPRQGPPLKAVHIPKAWALALILGLFLPRPWWDWGLRPESVLPFAAFGVGGAIACLFPIEGALNSISKGVLLSGLCLVGIAYGPSWGIAWGAAMGVLAANAYRGLPRPLPLGILGGFWVLGMLLSFTLQANAWIPYLGRLIWLGR